MQRLEKADFLSHVALRKFVPPFMRSEWMAKIWTHLWRRKYNMGVAIFMGVSLASLWKRWRVMAQAEKAKARKSGLKERPLDDLQMPKKSPLTALLGFDLAFLARLPRLFHILYPSIQSKETLVTAFLCLLLMVRTMLSIKIAEAMGYNAKCLVQRKLTRFVVGVIGMGIIIFPAAILSSGSKYFTNILALLFRKRLSRYVHKKYLDSEEMTFYKATLDDKMDNIDQRVSQDIDRFCRTLSHFCANMLKSSFDLMLYTTHLTMVLGFRGPLILYLYFTFGSLFLRFIMPPFAKFAGSLQQLEGIFRYQHSRLIAHAEEIAFYKGTKREQKIVNSSFDVIYNYASSIFKKQAVMGVMDELLVKYGGTLVGYIIVALPVFTVVTSGDSSSEAVAKLAGHLSNEYTLASPLDDYTISSQTSLIKLTATITGDYVNNTQVLINLGRSIARMVVLHREYLLLVGYTGRVFELLELLENVRKRATEEILAARDPQEFEEMEDENEMMKEGYYNSKMEEEETDGLDPEHFSSKHGALAYAEEMGRYVAGDHIQFDDVSVVTPDGMALIEGLTFDLPIGKNLLVSGPNGSGKSSLFRVMTKMWPLVKGTIVKPKEELIFYVPQRPYLTIGTLREQVIYPDSVEEMEAKGWTDKELSQLMKALDLLYLVQREGWAKRADWIEVLSGGESQRLAMARLFYHNPRFVILDECTGAIGAEVEAFIYEEMRKRGMTTITVSHRKRTLWRFHDFLLQLFGDGSWEWKQLDRKKEQHNHHYNNNHNHNHHNNEDNNDGHHHHHNHNHHNNPHRTHHFKSL